MEDIFVVSDTLFLHNLEQRSLLSICGHMSLRITTQIDGYLTRAWGVCFSASNSRPFIISILQLLLESLALAVGT